MTERERCISLLVDAMLNCVTFYDDVWDERIDAIKAAMRDTAESFLTVWDDSKAFGGRLIVDEQWPSREPPIEPTPAAGAEVFAWVKGRAAGADSGEGLREPKPRPGIDPGAGPGPDEPRNHWCAEPCGADGCKGKGNREPKDPTK